MISEDFENFSFFGPLTCVESHGLRKGYPLWGGPSNEVRGGEHERGYLL